MDAYEKKGRLGEGTYGSVYDGVRLHKRTRTTSAHHTCTRPHALPVMGPD